MNKESTFRENIKLIIIRRFINEAKANIYAILLIVLALIASAFFAFVRASKSHTHTIGMNSMTIQYSPLHPRIL